MRTATHTQHGIALVEVLIGVAIAGLVLVFVSHTLTLFITGAEAARDRTKALYLAEEGHEVIRYLRDSDWDTLSSVLSNDTTYYLAVATTSVATTTAPEIIDGTFTRSFQLSEVRRDGNDDIVFSGGTIDADARLVTFFVEWDNATITLDALLTNIHDI